MAERRPHRVYTVEEARRLPPPTADEIALRHAILQRVERQIVEDEEILGRPITFADVRALLDEDDADRPSLGHAK